MQKLLLLLLFILLSTSLNSQTVENINVPGGSAGSSMIGDILHANGKIFTYSANGILIYNAATNSFEAKIPFEGLNYGKFNPIYFNSRMNVPDQNLMVYTNDADNKFVYVITPKMQLLVIDPEPVIVQGNYNYNYWFSSLQFPTSEGNKSLSQLFKSQNGRSILRYDNSNKRLYILVSGKDLTSGANLTGEFHRIMHVFGIFNVDYNVVQNEPPIFNLHYNEINAGDDLYGDQINNFVFNETNDYFYLVRMSISTNNPTSTAIIDIREVTITGVTEPGYQIEFENTDGAGWFKMGKMLYIYDPNPNPNLHIHKILIFPYRYPSGTVTTPKYYVIDGDDPTINGAFVCPSKRILDAVYLEENQDLILSYAPDEPEIVGYDENSSIAIFRWNGTVFMNTQVITNDPSPVVSAFDINASFNLTKKNGSTAIVSRKDGVAQIKSNNEGHYIYTTLLDAESNFFKKGVSVFGKTFLINGVSNGLEIFSTENHVSINTGYPVYHICANNDGSRLLYYNKLSSQNIGLYTHSYYPTTELIININEGDIGNNIESAIGDVVYNNFQNHFLISKFESGSAKVMAIDADNNSLVSHINLENELPNVQFAKEMFIAPNGRLYVWANMANDPNTNPTVFVYDATDYSYIEQKTLDAFANFDNFIYYSAHTTYNPVDELVYSTITCQDMKLLPYNSEVNSLYNTTDAVPPGKLFDIINNNDFDLEFPGKIISPLAEGADNSSQYYGKLFIIGNEFYEYDYLNPPTNTSDIQNYPHHFVDITYSAKDDRLFAVKNIQGAQGNPEYRIFEIWTIDVGETGLEIEKFNTDGMPTGGQMSSIFSNPYDGKIYIYQKIDKEKLGEVQVNLLSFDTDNPNWNTLPLGITSYHPEYDHTIDPMQAYFYNITTPYINPYTNHIYLPNGGHSCVSKVEFTPNETMTLNPGSNWISIPRHSGNVTPGIYDPWPTSLVFHKDNFEIPYSRLELKHNKTQATSENVYKATYNIEVEFDWDYEDDMDDTYSYRGYKLDYFQSSSNTISLTGNVEDPNTTMHLYEDKENWIGYFLYEEQDIFDAIADIEGQLYMIKGQDYFCYRGDHEGSGGVPQPFEPWICDKLSRNIDYGEMVILKPYSDIPAFQWNYSGNPPSIVIDEELEYYSYTETSDYSAFIIELDSTENPVEMGAFVNDSCIGACTLTPEDTLVIIKGYLGSQPGDSVVFEEYFTQKATNNKRISDYFVYNSIRKVNEKRVVKTGENKDMYFISFNAGNEQKLTESEYSFSIFPNPTNNMLNINYSVENTTKVNISVFDSYGRQVATLLSKQVLLGSHTVQWNLIGSNGVKVLKGLYIIKLKINDVVVSKKVVVN